MTDYSAIATAIKTTIQADAWLGNTANLKTVEIQRRAFRIFSGQVGFYFRVEELPAVSIIVPSGPRLEDYSTTSEVRVGVPCEIQVVTHNRDEQAGFNAHNEIVNRLEALLQKQRNSVDDLGIGALLVGISTDQSDAVKDDRIFYLASVVRCIVEITETY